MEKAGNPAAAAHASSLLRLDFPESDSISRIRNSFLGELASFIERSKRRMVDLRKGIRMLLCALVYVVAYVAIIWLASLLLIDWSDASHIAAWAMGTMLVSFPLAFPFWTPLLIIEFAVFIWRPHPSDSRQDALWTILLVGMGLPTVLFTMTTHFVLQVYVQHRLFIYTLVPMMFSCGLCVPVFLTCLVWLARGTIRIGKKEPSAVGNEGHH